MVHTERYNVLIVSSCTANRPIVWYCTIIVQNCTIHFHSFDLGFIYATNHIAEWRCLTFPLDTTLACSAAFCVCVRGWRHHQEVFWFKEGAVERVCHVSITRASLLQSEQSPIVCLLHPSGLDIDFPGIRLWREWMLEGNTQPLLLVHDTTVQNLNFGQLTAVLASVLAFYQARLCGGRSFFHLLSTATLRSGNTLLQSWTTFSYYMCWA